MVTGIEICNQHMPGVWNGCVYDQGWADVLGIEDSSAETLNMVEKEKMKDIIDIPHLEDPSILLGLGSSYPLFASSDDLAVPESRPKWFTKVPA